MTVNLHVTPSAIHLTGDTKLHHHFGVDPRDYVLARPLGANPHIDVRLHNGNVKLELSPALAAWLHRGLLSALTEFPLIPDIHDAIVGDE